MIEDLQPVTIAEDLKRQTRRMNLVKWAIMLPGITVLYFLAFVKHYPRVVTYLFTAAVVLLIAWTNATLGRRLQCPSCDKSLYQYLVGQSTLHRRSILRSFIEGRP